MTSAQRSRTMRAVKGKNTTPEILVRRLVRGMGHRCQLHRKDLPGCPDFVFPSQKKIIFVHGCFWHGHSCARGSRVPKNNREYWVDKIGKNKRRDISHRRRLKKMGWNTLVVWECRLKSLDVTAKKLERFLND